MALNIAFDGFVYDKDSVIGNSNINYQAFFYPNGTASSPAAWNDVRTIESSGYYSVNLGDGDWMGQESVVLNNSIVLIVFWKGSPLGDNRNALCNVLEEWGAFELTLDGSSVYTQDAQVKDNIVPVLQWNHNIPAHGYVDTTYSTTNNSYDVHSWTFNGLTTSGSVDMYHWRTRYGENIQLINTVDGTNYYWGDTTSDLALSGASGSSHQWSSAGSYTIEAQVYDTCSGTASGTSNIDIYWHAPVPNITRCDVDGLDIAGNSIYPPDTPVYFKYNGTDIDDTITSIDWTINDSGVYGNTDTVISGTTISGVTSHLNGLGTSWEGHTSTSGAFTNPGSHTITVAVNWFDGHENQTTIYNENFTQQRFNGPPVPNLDCNEAAGQYITTPDTAVSFDYTGTNPDNRITGIDWDINDSGVYGNTDTVLSGVVYNDTVYHTEGLGTDWCGDTSTSGAFTNPGVHNIAIDVNWNDGWDDNVVSYDEDFTQSLFSGPTINFTQAPPLATVGSGVVFTNTSTDTSRVGLGLPDCTEYDWTWDDDGDVETHLDQPYSYQLSKVPDTANCEVQLCADWSDGWETQTTCLSDYVVFKTTVTITPEDCFYNLNLVGTSSDGSVSGYSWEIYKDSTCSGTCVSGTSGSWDLIWSSPTGMDENDKKVYFTEKCCYRVYGYVHGNGTTTNDYEDIYIPEVCVTSGIATCSGVAAQSGFIQIEEGWQMIAIPIEYGYWDSATHQHVHDEVTVAKFKNYVLDQIEDIYGNGMVEVANTYTGDNQAFYSYVVGSTPESSPHNFNMVYTDGLYKEISGFWIKSTSSGIMNISWGEE